MNLSLNEQLGEVSIPRATELYMEVRKSRTLGRWKVIVRWAKGASPLNLEEHGTFKIVIKFEEDAIPIMFITATNDTEECIHVQYMGNPPSLTDIGDSHSEELRKFSLSVQSEA